MSLAPLLDALTLIQLQAAAAALISVVLGPVAFLRRSRDPVHRVAGRARSLRLLSVTTLVGLVGAVRAIRAGDVAKHGATMRALYAQALMLAGAFTFLPGRRMSRAFFPDAPWLGLAVMLGVGCIVVWLLWRDGRKIPLSFPGGVR